MGAERRAHHRRVEAERAAQAEADRMEAFVRQQQENMMRMAEALKPAPVQTPKTARASLQDTGGGIRTARSRKQTTMDSAKGLASLRIPLNVGSETGGGLNIG